MIVFNLLKAENPVQRTEKRLFNKMFTFEHKPNP